MSEEEFFIGKFGSSKGAFAVNASNQDFTGLTRVFNCKDVVYFCASRNNLDLI